MKHNLKYFLFALMALLCREIRATAQIAVTAGMTYTQNFDGYLGTSAASLPAGWTIGGSFTYRGQGNGTSNSGGSWAYGIGGERALGYLGSGTSPSINYTVSFVNNTGSTITSLNISYDYEQWRFAGGNTNGWTVTGTGALAATSLSGLNTNSTGAGVSGVVNVTLKTISLAGLSIAPGAAFGIRWACGDGSGSDNGNGIDNFQMVMPCTPSVPHTIDTMLCFGSAYTWNANSYTTPQNITDTFTNAGGCDSVVTLDLGFYPQLAHSFSDTICYNQSYTWGAQTLTATGSYTQVFTGSHNCDSTVTLSLFEKPEITYNFLDTICFGTVYTWGTQTLNAAGTYTQTFTSASNCDSTVTLNLFERPEVTYSFADTICFGEAYLWGAQTLNSTGVFTQVFTAMNGCDSTVTLNLLERPEITHSFADTICFGDTYTWGTQTLSATGMYTQVFTAGSGCDSTVTLNLFERPEVTYSFADTICFGEAYLWGAQTLNSTGVFTQVFTAMNGCDSTVTLNLLERPEITHSFADTICFGDTYTWGTQTLNATGSYTQVFTAGSGCDSTVTLNLLERPEITYSFADTICFGDTYTWGTQTLSATGVYTQVFTAGSGCDSTVTLNLLERPEITYSFADTICFGDTYTWGTQTLNATGSYTQVFTAGSGCDSTVTLNLLERPEITYSFADTICFGDTYTWGTQTLNATGTYTQVLTAASNCDSTVTLQLFVRPQITNNVSATICSGNTYTFGTQALTITGTYTEVFTAASSCDSTVTLSLQVTPAITNTVSVAICYGAAYNWGSQVLNTAGIYTQTFPGAGGCDSIVTLTLSVNPAITNSITAVVCNGGTYTFGTQTLNSSGNYNQVFPAANGCDSSVNLTLFISPVALVQVTDTAACGVVTFEGNQYFSNIVLLDTLENIHNCDSVYRTVNITVYDNTPDQLSVDTSGCGSVLFEGNTYTQDAVLHNVYTSIHGCDSLERTVTIRIEQAQYDTTAATLCAGNGYDFHDTHYTSTGVYTAHYTGMHGCDSDFVLVLTINPLPVAGIDIPEKSSFCVGDLVELSGKGTYEYHWANEFGVDLGYGRDKEVTLYDYTSHFMAEVTDENGCRDTASVTITAQPCCSVWLPNAFSPNGDGLNDKFKPETNGHPKEYVMHIFDRWGAIVFSSFKIAEGWDGTLNGKPADIATYYYRITGKCVNGELLDKRGELTLIR